MGDLQWSERMLLQLFHDAFRMSAPYLANDGDLVRRHVARRQMLLKDGRLHNVIRGLRAMHATSPGM